MRSTTVVALASFMTAWLVILNLYAVAQSSDVSDAYWTIVIPRVTASDVDMGPVTMNGTRDSLLSDFLRNSGPVPVRVDSIRISGPDAPDFIILPERMPLSIMPGGASSVTCQLTPSSSGPKTATINVYTRTDTIVYSLFGVGVAPSLQVVPDVIDFGQVEVGSEKDTTIVVSVRNTGGGPLLITTSMDRGPDRTQFLDRSGVDEFTLSEGQSRSLTLRFAPGKSGRTSGCLEFRTDDEESGTLVYLYGEGRITPGLVATGVDTVVFPATRVGGVIDTTINDALVNIGARSVRIHRVELTDAGESPFACLSSDSDIVLPPGEGLSVKLRYAPILPGSAFGHVAFYHDGIDAPSVLHLSGVATTTVTGLAILFIDTVRAFVGDIVRIPVLLKVQQDLRASGATSISAELRFNSSLLSPVGDTPIGTFESLERILPLDSLPIESLKGDTIAILEFLATLGNTTGTPLIIDRLVANDGSAIITAVPGYFELLGFCEEGGARLFDANGTLSLRQNHPNPFNARTTISFELIESGPTRLIVKDVLGRTVSVLADGFLEKGQHTVSFDANALGSGTYLYLLQTPSSQLVRRLEVLK